MPRSSVKRANAKAVTVYDQERRESVSFTVYAAGVDASEVARRVHDALPAGWPKTSLDDRRHKRR